MSGRRRKATGGFTLLELLMVVIVIGILSAAALPQYFRVTERARTGQVLPLLAAVRASEIRFKAQDPSNVYTTTLASLDVDIPALPTGWTTVSVTGAAAGSNVQVVRSGGTYDLATLGIDLDNGSICASTAPAAATWNVGTGC